MPFRNCKHGQIKFETLVSSLGVIIESQAVEEQPTHSTCGINSRLLNVFTNFTNRHQSPSLLPWTSWPFLLLHLPNLLESFDGDHSNLLQPNSAPIRTICLS